MTADIVFRGGPVHVGDGARTRAQALAVRGERIVAVGPEADAMAADAREVVDLAGRLLIPGFQDAHVHPVGAGVELGACDLSHGDTIADYEAAVAEYAATHPEVEWITGGGWSMEAFPGGVPHRRILDRLVPDRPVYLVNRDHHGAWVNSRALEIASVDAATADPADGRIERDPDGAPGGMLQEGAMGLVAAVVPEPTAEEQLSGLLRAQRLLHSLGVTAWQDAIVGAGPIGADVTPAYLAAREAGKLTARVVGALWWRRDAGSEQVAELIAQRDRISGGRFRATSVKMMLDGVAENHTAAVLAPYLNGPGCACAPGGAHTGLSFLDPEQLPSYVTALDAEGFQVHFHALGDRAVRDGLDAIAAARAVNGFTDTRPQLAHLQIVHPDDLTRFASLGAIANLQTLWACHEPQMDDLTLPYLSDERASWQYPFGSLLRAGATLAAGSDWPVSSPDPLAAIHVAVNRVEFGADERPFYPAQAIDLGSALAAYTAGSAHANHLDDTGTLRVGNLADLVVLDRDPFAGPVDQIGATTVEQTFVGGDRVYASDSAR